jgi:hypothetical protein
MTLSLPDRMRAAAEVLGEVSALYGFEHPQQVAWTPAELRGEADDLEAAAS